MMTVTDDKNDGRVDNAIARDGQHLNERNDFPKGESHMDPEIGIATGNPGVFPGYPYPYPSLPVPGPWGTGLAGTGHGFFSMCHVSDTV